MRGTSAAKIVAKSPAALGLDALESHRDHHFRRTARRRVAGEKSALAFINEVGFCTGFSAGLGLPCLREAIAGEREPKIPEHLQHDYAIGMTWNIKDTLPAKRLVYYGKALAGRPSFIARDMMGAFLRLRIEAGGYARLYQRGLLGHCAKLVMDALTKRGASETMALKLASGYSQPKHRAEFDRAMKDLQGKFLALKVEERYEPFTYVWDTLEHRWPEALKESRTMSKNEAAYRIMRRYFEVAGFGHERALARILHIDPALVDAAARRLEREDIIARAMRIERLGGAYSVLRELI
ncbi:MAG TPA: hypothetical protein VKV03_05425 [Candidatus Binataceae bacterium]|nr:hypothetical protein [Candidatus Binataceae bacterium]